MADLKDKICPFLSKFQIVPLGFRTDAPAQDLISVGSPKPSVTLSAFGYDNVKDGEPTSPKKPEALLRNCIGPRCAAFSEGEQDCRILRDEGRSAPLVGLLTEILAAIKNPKEAQS